MHCSATGYIPKDLCKANLFHWPRLSLQILKNPLTISCGHGIKDIEIHVCLPSVKITAISCVEKKMLVLIKSPVKAAALLNVYFYPVAHLSFSI